MKTFKLILWLLWTILIGVVVLINIVIGIENHDTFNIAIAIFVALTCNINLRFEGQKDD